MAHECEIRQRLKFAVKPTSNEAFCTLGAVSIIYIFLL